MTPCPLCSYVLVLEAGGGELAVAATAAALALADAGVEMFDLVTACSVVRACPPERDGWPRAPGALVPACCCCGLHCR